MGLKLPELWLGPLPKEEIISERKRSFWRHWFFHPVKRRLAKLYLFVLKSVFGLRVIAITGSVGKTTTKDMLYSVLSVVAPTVATTANITPTYNIPTTILRCTPRTKYLILEMGIEYVGDMDFYTWLARPDIAIITAVDITHTEFLGDIKTVAHEKGKIAKLARYLVIPENAPNIEINTKGRVVKVSVEAHALPEKLLGSHFNLNASLAIAVAKLLKVPPETFSELSKFNPPRRRMELIKLSTDSYIIDDTYNANPLAVREALKTLSETAEKLKKNPVFVFGQMNELGQYEKKAHSEVGLLVRDLKQKMGGLEFFCIGQATKYALESAGFGKYFETQDDLLNILKPFVVSAENLILIKGSRSWHLDELVDKLNKS